MRKPLSSTTLARVRESHIATLTETCEFLYNNVLGSNALGDESIWEPIFAPDPIPPILASVGDYSIDGPILIPCRIQSARAEDIKSLDVSSNKRLFWLFLPWWIEDVREEWKQEVGRDEFGNQGGMLRINSGDYEIAQIMTTGANRLMSKMLITQRQAS